jgi:hypothetical protein
MSRGDHASNVSNYSQKQPNAQKIGQFPMMYSSAFGAAQVPGGLSAPFGIPFSAPHLQSAAGLAGDACPASGVPATAIIPSRIVSATDNLACTTVTVYGLEKGQGCVVTKTGQPAVTIDLTGTNPYNYTNGANKIMVTGDAQSQKCVINYSDMFDTGSISLDTNANFQACI